LQVTWRSEKMGVVPGQMRLAAYLWIIVLILIPGTAIYGLAARPSSRKKKEVQTATEIRLMDPGWWPTKGTAAREEYAGPAACTRCHADIASTQTNTLMAHALTAASSTAFPYLSKGAIRFAIGSYNYELASTASGASYSVSDGTQALSTPVEWIFGDGGFGRTFLYEQNGSFYESRLSYYTQGQLLDFTTGNPRSAPGRLEAALGRRMPPSEPGSCFVCHATAASTNGHFDPEHLIAGVTCEACHGPGAEHAAAMNIVGYQQSPPLIMNPARLGPVDSVDFCGACHRTSVDVALTGVTGILTLRFPAYRLGRSPCWGSGDARLTCTACHNPHQPLVRDAESYDKNCFACHLGSPASKPAREHPASDTARKRTKTELAMAPACPVARKSCVTCHMPKHNIPEMHATFTDHKIGIHPKDESFGATSRTF
jgi:Cytochrome c554 and c-prime